MNSFRLTKKFLLPCGLCAVPLVDKKELQLHPMDNKKNLIRPTELPIYSDEEIKPPEKTRDDGPPSVLEQGFGTVRRSITGVLGQFSGYTDVVTKTIDTGLAHSQGALDYLQEESNTMPRMGAIGIGGLTGFIFALRGGKFKKLVYTTTGVLTIAALCHPREAQESWDMANHYANIAYNFVYGVKPGDEKQVDFHLPHISDFKMPSSMSDISEMAKNAGCTVMRTFNSLTGSSEESVKQNEIKPPAEDGKKSK